MNETSMPPFARATFNLFFGSDYTARLSEEAPFLFERTTYMTSSVALITFGTLSLVLLPVVLTAIVWLIGTLIDKIDDRTERSRNLSPKDIQAEDNKVEETIDKDTNPGSNDIEDNRLETGSSGRSKFIPVVPIISFGGHIGTFIFVLCLYQAYPEHRGLRTGLLAVNAVAALCPIAVIGVIIAFFLVFGLLAGVAVAIWGVWKAACWLGRWLGRPRTCNCNCKSLAPAEGEMCSGTGEKAALMV